jgi:phage FluMu protein Com
MRKVSAPRAQVATTLPCPHCGASLWLVESESWLCLTCPSCMRMACVTDRSLLRYLDYKRKRFDWRKMLGDMHRTIAQL